MEKLLQQQCVPVGKDEPALTDDEIRLRLSKIPYWELVEEDNVIHLRREFRFPDFFQALLFANKVGEKAETQNHHPRIMVEWGQTTVEWWTHTVGGLHENDFVMAAKSDDIYSRWNLIGGQKDTVQEASEESFPASDAPAW